MHLKGVSCGERNSAMAQVRKAVHAVDGSLNSHERYNDAAASVTFEIDGGRIVEFLDLLAAADIRVAEGIGEYGHSGQVRCGLTIRFADVAADGPGPGE
jgi:hypothetical protein